MVHFHVHDDAEGAARGAAQAAERLLQAAIGGRRVARVVASSSPSQVAFLEHLVEFCDVDWSAVELFQLDEFVGLDEQHPASLTRFLLHRLVALTGISSLHLIDGAGNLTEVCSHLGALLAQRAPDVVFIGIGENGRIGFNDPPADVTTEQSYTVVDLGPSSRLQEVAEGRFETLDDVPTQAVSMSMHQILAAHQILGVVTGEAKAAALQACFEGVISPDAPASYLRQHAGTHLYVDEAAVSRLDPALLTA